MRVDFLLLADKAEAVGGKLYLMGGGFDRIALAQLPGAAPFDLALGVLVDFSETGIRHRLTLVLEDADRRTVAGPIPLDIELGRPPGLEPGAPQRFVAVLQGPFPVPGPGMYTWALSLDGNEPYRTAFWVSQAQLFVSVPPGTGQPGA